MPTVDSPPPIITAPMAGISARGWARIMATRSIMNVIRRLGRVPRKRKPSTTDRSPARPAFPEGGIDGSRNRAQQDKHEAT